jgi:hypothetical protein
MRHFGFWCVPTIIAAQQFSFCTSEREPGRLTCCYPPRSTLDGSTAAISLQAFTLPSQLLLSISPFHLSLTSVGTVGGRQRYVSDGLSLESRFLSYWETNTDCLGQLLSGAKRHHSHFSASPSDVNTVSRFAVPPLRIDSRVTSTVVPGWSASASNARKASGK